MQLVGVHYLPPVGSVRLVEVVPHETTDPDVLAAALRMLREQRKTPVIVRDSPGYFVSRWARGGGQAQPAGALTRGVRACVRVCSG